jgi:hypothetical protein
MSGDAHGGRVTLEAHVAALATKSTAELAADYIALFGHAPRRRNPVYLRKRLAHRLQADALGGLPRAARDVLDRLMATIEFPAAAPTQRVTDPKDGDDPRLRPGSVLTRVWHGRTVRVEVTHEGFVFDGETFKTLTAVARKVTNQHWSGALFFNLRARRKP